MLRFNRGGAYASVSLGRTILPDFKSDLITYGMALPRLSYTNFMASQNTINWILQFILCLLVGGAI